MPPITTLEWECVELSDTLLNPADAHLYLVYFIAKSGQQGAPPNVMHDHWVQMASKMKPSSAQLIPLCAATKEVGSGGTNWMPCSDDKTFPDGENRTPHAMWFMATPTAIDSKYAKGHDFSYCFDSSGQIVIPSAADAGRGVKPSTQAKSILSKPVLAKALAVQWLLNNRPCDTKAAILKSGLLEELCPHKPTGPLPADATPADATETA